MDLDPKAILGPDLYAATQTKAGKYYAQSLGNIAAAAAKGDEAAVWSASEAMVTGIATAALGPEVGVFLGTFFALVDAFGAKGSGYVDPVCGSDGSHLQGYPTAEMMQGWAAPGSDNQGTYSPWLAASLALEPDAFLRAMRAAIAYHEGKQRNCYADYIGTKNGAIDYGKILALAIAAWNGANAANGAGQVVTVTRTIRGIDMSRTVTGFGGKQVHPQAPIPADWDLNDRKYAAGETTALPQPIYGQQMGTLPLTYANLCQMLWEAQTGQLAQNVDAASAPAVTLKIVMPRGVIRLRPTPKRPAPAAKAGGSKGGSGAGVALLLVALAAAGGVLFVATRR